MNDSPQKLKHECKSEGCKSMIDQEKNYCSIECACYSGVFSVTKGWIQKEKEGNNNVS